jgi:hypothetical protein
MQQSDITEALAVVRVVRPEIANARVPHIARKAALPKGPDSLLSDRFSQPPDQRRLLAKESPVTDRCVRAGTRLSTSTKPDSSRLPRDLPAVVCSTRFSVP